MKFSSVFGDCDMPPELDFMSQDDYDQLVDLLQTALQSAGEQFSVSKKTGQVLIGDGSGVLGLANLAQNCHQSDKADWPKTVLQQFPIWRYPLPYARTPLPGTALRRHGGFCTKPSHNTGPATGIGQVPTLFGLSRLCNPNDV